MKCDLWGIALIALLLVAGCTKTVPIEPTQSNTDNSNTTLNTSQYNALQIKFVLTIYEHLGYGKPDNVKFVSGRVTEGREFGSINYLGSNKKKPFKLLSVLDGNRARVQFDDSLVLAGEPIAEPSNNNPSIISTNETCFQTRLTDSGSDLCLNIVN